jgi:putative transport protein
MVEWVRVILEQSPLLALFAVIGIGYALGQISIAGFSLGVGAVLFAGLAVGALAPGSVPPSLVNSIGLAMFLYGVGIQYGRAFFAGLRGPGVIWNLLGAAGVFASLAVALVLGQALGVAPEHAMGVFAGGLTSTPALQAAIDAAGNSDPAIGYSVAYPLGVVGPILCLFVFTRLFKPRVAPALPPPQPIEITLEGLESVTVAELMDLLPPGVHLSAIRHDGASRLPDPHARVAAGDGVLLYGQPEMLERARRALGRVDPGRFAKDRSALDVVRAFVSRPAVVGTAIGELRFPDGTVANVTEVRRGDAQLMPANDLVLEYGDRVGAIVPRESIPAVRTFFGDSLKSAAEFSYVSVGLGMSLGVLLGLVKFPLPGLGTFSLGLAGGPLLVALVLGRLGRSGSLSWHMPLAANLTLRSFGLTLFLAAVGLGAGAPFVAAVSSAGAMFLALGTATVLAGFLVLMALGQYALRMSTDDLFGVVSGTAGNPAILAYAVQAVKSDRLDIAFATVYPSTTILKIICAQVAMSLLAGR